MRRRKIDNAHLAALVLSQTCQSLQPMQPVGDASIGVFRVPSGAGTEAAWTRLIPSPEARHVAIAQSQDRRSV